MVIYTINNSFNQTLRASLISILITIDLRPFYSDNITLQLSNLFFFTSYSFLLVIEEKKDRIISNKN